MSTPEQAVLAVPAPVQRFSTRGRSSAQPVGTQVTPATLAVLLRGTHSPDYGTRILAVEALARVHVDSARGRLRELLGDPEPDVRVAAVLALSAHAPSYAHPLLRSVRDDEAEHLYVRVAAARALLPSSVR